MAATAEGRESSEASSFISENGVEIEYKVGSTPSEKAKAHNPRTSICRELALCTLHALTSEMDHPPFALDAIAATGLAGLQWKVCLSAQVHVTLAERDDSQVQQIAANAGRNQVETDECKLQPGLVPSYPASAQAANHVAIAQADAAVLLLLHAFDFVYLDAHKNLTNYFETLFRNVRNLGVVSFLVSDVSMFSRSPQVISRHYGATVTKTEYLKELATRVVIASMVRSAAHSSKGVEVLYVYSFEDFLFIAVRVLRGPKQADISIAQLRRVLHCQMCEERVFLPHTRAPVESPYSLLSCQCQASTPGKTAVELGPVWSGSLFNSPFLEKMGDAAKTLRLSGRVCSILVSLLRESQGGLASSDLPSPSKTAPHAPPSVTHTSTEPTEPGAVPGEPSDGTKEQDKSSLLDDRSGRKRPAELGQGEEGCQTSSKQCRLDNGCHPSQPATSLPFYYNLQKQKLKNTALPKLGLLISMLRGGGFQACRTHFDPCALRTNATLADLLRIVLNGTITKSS